MQAVAKEATDTDGHTEVSAVTALEHVCLIGVVDCGTGQAAVVQTTIFINRVLAQGAKVRKSQRPSNNAFFYRCCTLRGTQVMAFVGGAFPAPQSGAV